MGNGAMPHAPSNRAHPRLYHNAIDNLILQMTPDGEQSVAL